MQFNIIKKYVHLITIPLLILSCAPSLYQSQSQSQCISGNCINGQGTYVYGAGEWEGQTYVGGFKDVSVMVRVLIVG